jgi:hypothetical protein
VAKTVMEGVKVSKNFGDELVDKEQQRCHAILNTYKQLRIKDHQINLTNPGPKRN